MRVIAGKAKGVRLKVPGAARPTTDRVRAAIFSILDGEIEGVRVLDLYAGSGALGIEALSRGAGWVDFVDQAAGSCAAIQDNLNAARFFTQAKVYCAPVRRALSFLPQGYDIVFMDPPYSLHHLDALVAEVAGSPQLKDGSLLVVAHSSRLLLSPAYAGLTLVKQRRHGDTCISIFQRGSAQ